jgi:hypothetical protein
MAQRYAEPGTITTGGVTSSFKTGLVLAGIATRRVKIYHFALSTLGVAADGVLEWIIQKFTAAGTTTAVTPRNLDGTDLAVAAGVAGSNATVEPTYTASSAVFDEGVNQRATYTWNAWTEGAQLVSPSVAASGFGIAALSSVAPAYTGIAAMHIHHEE